MRRRDKASRHEEGGIITLRMMGKRRTSREMDNLEERKLGGDKRGERMCQVAAIRRMELELELELEGELEENAARGNERIKIVLERSQVADMRSTDISSER